MSKTLLVGPAGCGKTHLLLDAFEKTLREAPDPLASDMFFVVPSMEHTERVVSLLIQRGVKGFFHKRVTTLSKLISDLFRITDLPVASSLTRAMIARDLLRTNAWEYFAQVQDQPGFLSLILQFITELKEACFLPDVFREQMNALKGFEPAYAAKYEALAAFYEQYEEELKKRGLRDGQDALRIFRERIPKGDAFPAKFKALWIDGFFDFSNLQLEYLMEICGMADEVTITLTREEGTGSEEAFEAVDRTQVDLEKIGFKIRRMKPHSFRTQSASLLFLQKNLFNGTSDPRQHPVLNMVSTKSNTGCCPSGGDCPPEDIVFLEAVGMEGEIELIAREVHRLYAAGDYRYSDFVVLFRQIKNYGQVIGSIFQRYGIPVEMHERDRLKFSPWIGTAVSLLSIFKNKWQAEDLLGFLKSNHVRRTGRDRPKDDEWIAMLEQRALQEGVSGSREAWLADWKGQGKEDLAVFNQEKAGMLKVFAALEDDFLGAKTVDEHIRIFKNAVHQTFGMIEISEEYTPLVRRDAACVARFEALLEEMRRYFLKDETTAVSFEGFADYFMGLVELDVYSLHERDKNRVQIYDVSLARQKEYKVVFVAGLLEKVFPMQVREDPLLSDWERKLLNGRLKRPLAERLPRQGIERFLFYLAVTRASQRLYLSYPHLDIEGKESLPSFYVEEVRELLGGPIPVIRQDLARPYPLPEEAITRRERETAAFGALRNCEGKDLPQNSDFKQALSELLADPQSKERLLAALKSIEAELLDKRILDGGYFEVPETSPTRLEEYAKCPYRYFANRILKLQDPAEDINVMRKGNILHYVLERYFDPDRKKKTKETLEAFIKRELEEGLAKYPLVWPEKYREELDRRDLFEALLYFLQDETERLAASSFHPAHVEYNFSSEPKADAPALEIGDKKKKIKLRGHIDRVDVDREGKYAVVIDYKSGKSTSFKRDHLELGTALQLPLYLLAAQRILGLTPLGGEIYSIRGRRRSGFYCEDAAASFGKEFSSRSRMPATEFQKVLDRALDFSRRFTESMLALQIPVRPRDCQSSCPYDTVCRIQKWRLPLILQEIKDEEKNRDS